LITPKKNLYLQSNHVHFLFYFKIFHDLGLELTLRRHKRLQTGERGGGEGGGRRRGRREWAVGEGGGRRRMEREAGEKGEVGETVILFQSEAEQKFVIFFLEKYK
jgi:hypothetical protein